MCFILIVRLLSTYIEVQHNRIVRGKVIVSIVWCAESGKTKPLHHLSICTQRHPGAHHSWIAVKTSLFTLKCTLRMKNETPAKCPGPTSASRGLLYNFISNWRGARVSEGSCLPDSESWSTSASLWVTTQSWARLLQEDRQSGSLTTLG